MTKAIYDTLVSALTAQGISNYTIRCENGNRIGENNESGILIPLEGYVVSIVDSKNIAVSQKSFVITLIPYENIDTVVSSDISIANAMLVAKAVGVDTTSAAVTKYFSTRKTKREIIPGTAGRAIMTDNDGNPVLGKGSSGYLT